jgi:pyrroloquinoline quinone biosynthesis protein D
MVQLNQSAAEVLRRCDGTRQIGDVIGDLETAFDTQGIGPEVLSLLEEAHRRGWIE